MTGEGILLEDVSEVEPEYESGTQIDLVVTDGSLQGTYSTVIQEIDRDRLRLETPQVNGLYLPVGSGEEVILKQYAQGATFEGESRVVERVDADEPDLFVDRPETVKRIQRRDFVRVPCDLDAEVFVLNNPEGDTPSDSLEGTLEDISAGGVQLSLDRRLPLFTEIELVFTLPMTDRVLRDVFGEVVRVPDQSEPPHSLGVEFTSITEKNRNDIIQYVYKRQRDLKNK